MSSTHVHNLFRFPKFFPNVLCFCLRLSQDIIYYIQLSCLLESFDLDRSSDCDNFSSCFVWICIFSVFKFAFVWLDWCYVFSGISTQNQSAILIIYQGTISMTPLYVVFDPGWGSVFKFLHFEVILLFTGILIYSLEECVKVQPPLFAFWEVTLLPWGQSIYINCNSSPWNICPFFPI